VGGGKAHLTFFKPPFCRGEGGGGGGGGQSQHAEREIAMPFQILFPYNRSVEYAQCYERRRAFSCIAHPMTYTVT